MDDELSAWNSEPSIGMPQPAVHLEEGNFHGSEQWKKVKEKQMKQFGPDAIARRPQLSRRSECLK
jgi:hypothetical protein